MNMPNTGFPSLSELVALHSPLGASGKYSDIDFDIIEQRPMKTKKSARDKQGIYLLIQDRCPVYLGKSVEPFKRLTQHFSSSKVADAAYSFETGSLRANPEVMSYIEFLCFYSLWTMGYCLIYNSLNVWNTLPIRNKSGPIFANDAISVSHIFAIKFVEALNTLNLESPDTAPHPLEIELAKHKRKGTADCWALYWRPTIKEKHFDMALNCWGHESAQRPQFAGAGSFLMVPPSTGKPWGNYDEQRLTYELLIRLGVLKVDGNVTRCMKSHPFPKANLMMGNLNGGQSITARSDLVVKETSVTVAELESQWKKHRTLMDPSL